MREGDETPQDGGGRHWGTVVYTIQPVVEKNLKKNSREWGYRFQGWGVGRCGTQYPTNERKE